MVSQYSVTTTETLWNFCIRKNWFTAGSNEQFNKMLALNKEKRPLEEVSLAIWLCSSNVFREEIQKSLEELHGDYLLYLTELEQAEGERRADEMYCAEFE